MSALYPILIKCMSRLFGCVCVSWFHSQGVRIGAPSTRLSQVALLALLADLVQYVFVGFCLGLTGSG